MCQNLVRPPAPSWYLRWQALGLRTGEGLEPVEVTSGLHRQGRVSKATRLLFRTRKESNHFHNAGGTNPNLEGWKARSELMIRSTWVLCFPCEDRCSFPAAVAAELETEKTPTPGALDVRYSVATSESSTLVVNPALPHPSSRLPHPSPEHADP